MAKKRSLHRFELQEISEVLEYARSACSTPREFYMKMAIRRFMNGEDAESCVLSESNSWLARRAANDARDYLASKRRDRRGRKVEIQAAREEERKRGEFTFENFRVKMDNSENRNFGAMNVSIYCIVEVWMDDESVEKEYLVNYSDYKTKEWLTKLLVWGLMNKREILIKPATQTEMSTMKMFVPNLEKRAST